MKKITLLLIVLTVQTIFAQQPYYNDVNLTLTGQDLYLELQSKIAITNTSFTYGDVRDSVKITDENPSNSNDVLLIYGYDDSGSCTNDRSRDKDDFGGSNCEYNREHVFARSNANPSMGNTSNSTTGIGADPHNLRPSDQQMNGNRGNRKFASGSGNAGNAGSNWYPGDEFKGDVARMMMYMYTRYGNRCLPSLNGSGATQGSTEMLQVYLEWNAEDPVSALEDQRNPYLENEYGNRNPFIDNPYLATIIWGGTPAEDRWELFSVEDNLLANLEVYPNPASEVLWIQNSTIVNNGNIIVYDLLGREVLKDSMNTSKTSINTSTLTEGLYLVKIVSENSQIIKKVIIN
ncbi:MAG: endonuclease [Flavobacteriaceae bacterium]|nr:endonuclease [Flavobacteriaceae bacterium]